MKDEVGLLIEETKKLAKGTAELKKLSWIISGRLIFKQRRKNLSEILYWREFNQGNTGLCSRYRYARGASCNLIKRHKSNQTCFGPTRGGFEWESSSAVRKIWHIFWSRTAPIKNKIFWWALFFVVVILLILPCIVIWHGRAKHTECWVRSQQQASA